MAQSSHACRWASDATTHSTVMLMKRSWHEVCEARKHATYVELVFVTLTWFVGYLDTVLDLVCWLIRHRVRPTDENSQIVR